MSGFFGEFRHDGASIDREALVAMAQAVPWYGIDGEDFWHAPGIGLGVLLTCTTPESCHESPIVKDIEGTRLLAGSVRIDNREELIGQLELPPISGRPVTDAELVLAAHAHWGADFAVRLLGDFAFALWNDASRQLLLVRDQIGIVPLFYYETETGVLFANDLRALAAHPRGPGSLDPVSAAHHLRDAQYLLGDRTYLAGVRRLPGGHVLTASSGQCTRRRYWFPERAPRVRLPDANAYAQQLRVLFERSVASRLRGSAPVGAHVSGGLDSTAIALEAQRQLRQRGESLAGAFTWLPDVDNASTEEAAEYVATRNAEQALDLPIERVALTPAALLREWDRNIALEGYADLWYEQLVRERAKGRGIKTLLSGWGGDDVVTSGINGYAAELFWTGRWIRLGKLARWRDRQLLAELPDRLQRSVWHRLLGFFYGQVVLPSLPAWLFRRWTGRRRVPLPGFQPEDPILAPLGGRLPPASNFQKAVGKRVEMARSLTAGHLQDRIETWWMQGARDGIRYVYPLLDRRLIEFCLGAPPALFVSPTRTRWLFREAMHGLLPENIRLASVKIEAERVHRLVDTMQTALVENNEKGKAVPDAASCIAQIRRRQIHHIDQHFKPRQVARGPDMV
ncbi:hypothetical protein F2Q65_02495 [Thiohalocapsa marina]|uniref:asparagine synthase (glutamine-hydrolyzing) n=1 Tax=Thiohalocapsa marina TaxID=424902 RepID=A0A5M8FUB3_9GAMM|nr:asparagine synthetase B [Thiohalocapsa marina]KAA6187411.1 hypothetical protein F2Q65_02495 [Thiohalocapsa marina]